MKPSVQRLLSQPVNRRSFFKSLGSAAAGLGALGLLNSEEIEGAVRNVQRNSIPSQLKITDLRVAVITGAPMTVPLIRIDTSQGISGFGEVRDGGSKIYALMLKSRLLGENPCNVDKLFRKIKQFGGPARQAGGVCGVEMALWDLAGKAYGVPVYQMLGGKFRDEVRLYADTTEAPAGQKPAERKDNLPDGIEEGKRLKARMAQGITFLKQDFGIGLLRNIPGTLSRPAGTDLSGGARVMHPFTGIEITDKGVEILSNYVGEIRSVIGMEVPLSSDHYGHISVNSCIKLARAMEKHNLAWMEDMVPWQFGELLKQIKDATTTPILTGEDIYLKEDFMKLISMGAVDMIHPDLASAGGILETKKIGDYAMEHGVPMAMHFAGSPVSFRANVHCAAATENFLALEHHSLDVPWWESMVRTKTPLVKNGFAPVPDEPGLGIDDLVPEVIKQHLHPDHPGYFEPTPEWDRERVNDRLWS
ncbi:MAG TPA: mandelate racemase/muconate lactonizing enzyme family protein [Blastocatellia bacterium]|nr:mandelate racemase/muconate lactonizing enzyme family protein [Blastocatellia bacterium]